MVQVDGPLLTSPFAWGTTGSQEIRNPSDGVSPQGNGVWLRVCDVAPARGVPSEGLQLRTGPVAAGLGLLSVS